MHTHHHIEDHHHAPECDDQLPLFARVGRGIKGNSFKVRIADPETDSQTYLEGLEYDEATKEWHTEWISENLSGGKLTYQYNLRPYTTPATFTITFIYRRPGREEWSWTTPAIPYIWTIGDDGSKSDPDAIVGSGVATLFIRESAMNAWKECLHYPEGTTRDDYNAPQPEEAWSATITFGLGGDIEVPNYDELAKILGVTREQIENMLGDTVGALDGSDNLKDYIDDKVAHIHEDMGFHDGLVNDGDTLGSGNDTIKLYVDNKIADVMAELAEIKGIINNFNTDLAGMIYGATKSDDGHISIPSGTKIPTGNINVLSGSDLTYSIRTSANIENNDIRAE